MQLGQFIIFLQIKTYNIPKKCFLPFAMSDVQIRQARDTLHVDSFNSISQKSNNE